MTDYYDTLEIMSAAERESLLLEKLNSQIQHARNNTDFYLQYFKDITLENLTSIDQLIEFPLTRKSELQQQQIANPPFGGLTAVQEGQLGNVFASPGPIYEPSTKKRIIGGLLALFMRLAFGKVIWL